MKQVTDDKIVVMIGKRNTGKSFLIRQLLYQHRDIPIGTVISPTESANKMYGDFVPSAFIHEEYSPQVTNNVMQRQKMIVKSIENETASGVRSRIDPRAFFVMDDCLFDNTWQKDKVIREIFMNGRHWKILYVLAMQYVMGVPPILRSNIDFVFLLRENNVQNRKKLYEQYAGMFPTFEIFCHVMDSCTENYECLVINNTARSNKLEQIVFWYKADPVPPFRMGAPTFWQAAAGPAPSMRDREAGTMSSLMRREAGFDPSQIRRRTGPYINVKRNGSSGEGGSARAGFSGGFM